MHAEHADELLVGAGERAQAHQRVGHRVAGQRRQLAQLVAGIGQHHAAAGVDIRTLGALQQGHGLADLARVALVYRVVRAHVDRLGVLVLAGIARDILGDVHHHRAGTAGRGNEERLLDGRGEIAHVLHQEVVLDDRAGDTDRVALLESVLANGVGRHVAGDHHHRDRVEVRGGNAGDGIGHAGTGGHQRYAHLAGRPCIAVCGMNRGLLVAHQDVLELLLLVELVVDVQHCAAGIAPDVLDAFFGKCVNENFRPDHFGCGR
ncbi:hypothetical protein D3C72_1224780 [compost metagenome]